MQDASDYSVDDLTDGIVYTGEGGTTPDIKMQRLIGPLHREPPKLRITPTGAPLPALAKDKVGADGSIREECPECGAPTRLGWENCVLGHRWQVGEDR